jgi:hypothetical protein
MSIEAITHTEQLYVYTTCIHQALVTCICSTRSNKVTFPFTDFNVISSNTSEVLEKNKTEIGDLSEVTHTLYHGVLYLHNVMRFTLPSFYRHIKTIH